MGYKSYGEEIVKRSERLCKEMCKLKHDVYDAATINGVPFTEYNNIFKNVADIKPSFKVGDVVNIYDDPVTPYVIKETIELNNEKFVYHVTTLDESDISHIYEGSLLEFQYHDPNYEQYFTESIENGLPPWRGEIYDVYTLYRSPETHSYDTLSEKLTKEYENDTIPPERMQHILHDHSIYDRIYDVIRYAENKNNIAESLGISVDDVGALEDSIKRKINFRNLNFIYKDLDSKKKKFTPLELQFATQIDKLDRKDLYRVEMTNLQIMQAIKEAYSNAKKAGELKIQFNTKDDSSLAAPDKGKRLYEGYSSKYNLIIQFWYNFDLDIIETAYPVTSDRSKKH